MDTPLRILIAEDNRVLADVIRFNLTGEGFDVTVAHDGRKALTLAQAETFDLVISDYQMPGLCGRELLHGIRQKSASHNAVCVLCSAKGYELDEEQFRDELALDRIVMKPFSPGDLINIAREVAAGGGYRPSNSLAPTS